MYYDDDDDDPYAPRTGPAAMPSPRSKFAPYYSGCTDSFEDFLEEYEGLAHDCALTDPQRVDVLIRYVAPSLRDFWRSLNGYRSHDWPLFRQSLIDVFGNPTPRHQIMRQKLHSHVQDSSRRRMDCEDDVLQYYRQFLCYSAPLVHAGHLSEEERDAAFWYGFHPEDRQVLQPRLLSKNPLQPPDIPFHFEDIFCCARGAFAFGNPFPPWLHEQQFQSSSARHEQLVAKHGSRDTYGLREMSRAVTSNAETTSNLDVLPSPPQSTPQPQFPSPSPSVLEPHQTQAPSMTLDQPEPAYTLSTTLLPSAFPTPSHASSLARSATDNDPIFVSTPPSSSVSSTFLPSTTPSPTPTHSLAPSAVADVPEISCTHSWSSTTPTPTTLISSDFEYLPSATVVDQPEHAPTLSSTPPSLSPTSSTFLPSPTQSVIVDHLAPELVSASSAPPSLLLLSIPPSMSYAHSPAPSAIDDDSELTFTPPAPSVSSIDVECLHSPVRLMTDGQPESEPASMSDIPVSKLDPSRHALSLPHHSSSPPGLSLRLCDVPANLAPSPSTFRVVFSASSDLSSASPPSSLVLGDLELESSPALAPSDVVTLSHPESSLSSPGEPVPFLPASPEAPPIAHISPCSTPPQRLPEVKTISSVSTRLEVTPAPASLAIPFAPQSQELPTVNEVWSTLAPRFPLTSPPLTLSRSGLARFNFSLVLITTTVLVSTLFNASTTLSILAHKYWNKNEDFGNIQIGTLNTSSRDVFAQRLRLGHPTPRGTRFVFDPGGVFKFKRSSSRLPSAHEDVRKRMPKTRNGFITHVAIPVPVPIDNLVFDPGGQSPSSSVQVQDYFRHTKAFNNARRRHAAAAPRSTPAPSLPF
ncbi:hypothetical protein EDB85DRAFT_2161497 [Lactarius pseudohatsudake]|nr:hypothetical protein EDB85DRAFT_2161497 [Lactarius pseudohatsudake]